MTFARQGKIAPPRKSAVPGAAIGLSRFPGRFRIPSWKPNPAAYAPDFHRWYESHLRGDIMKAIRFQSVLLTVLLAGASVRAEIIPGRWEKVAALPPGTGVTVWLQAGDRWEGSFRSLGNDDLVVSDPGGAERRVPKTAVLRIESAGTVRDRLGNGALIGAGIGCAAGVVSFLSFARSKTASGPFFYGETRGVTVAAALVGGGLGALAGAAVDASIKGHEVLYRDK
jgi:hypothetical protein